MNYIQFLKNINYTELSKCKNIHVFNNYGNNIFYITKTSTKDKKNLQ
jgi:hypothetical protein